MLKIRKWPTLLLALIMMLNGTLAVYAKADGIPAELHEEYIEQIAAEEEDAISGGESTDEASDLQEPTEGEINWEQIETALPDNDSPAGLPEAQFEDRGPTLAGDQMPEPSDYVPERKYAFAVAASGSKDYNLLQDHTMRVGAVVQYDLYFMQYNDEENRYDCISTPDEGMGIGLTCEAPLPFYVYWDWFRGTRLEIAQRH